MSTVHGLLKGFHDHQLYQREVCISTRFNSLHSGEVSERLNVSPVLGIDGKNPKSRTVPPGFRSSCGQEPDSSTGQTAKITAVLTLEDRSGLFQTQGTGTR